MAEEEEPPKKKCRFSECSSTDVDSLLKSRVPKTTVFATDFWMKILLSYITEKKLTVKLDTSPITDVATLLEHYYVDLPKKDGSLYKWAIYLAARAAIHRYLSSVRAYANIYTCPEFEKSNKVLYDVLNKKHHSGEEPAAVHKEGISDGDWARLTDYFASILDTKTLGTPAICLATALRATARGKKFSVRKSRSHRSSRIASQK